MGIFDIFTNDNADAARNAQIGGLNAGNTAATGNINAGIGALTSNYTQALQPFLTNYNSAQGGVQQLGNLLGLNGAGGNQAALTSLQNTPGYQFSKDQGEGSINAYHAATGNLASGNTMIDLSKFNQGLAGTTYQNAVQNLMPFLGASNSAASGIANTYTGLGQGIAGLDSSLAGLNWQTQTGIGNANANADLANNNASANFWNMLGGIGGMKTSGGGTIGGNAASGIGNAVSGIGSAAMSALPMIFSDVRLKENIEPVGELYDGTGVYRYNYKGSDVPQIGVMAQEVEQSRPDAVAEISGFKAVDYRKATDLAASLAGFVHGAAATGDNVVRMDDRRPTVASGLKRFLEAA